MNSVVSQPRLFTLGGLVLLIAVLVLESQGWLLPGLSDKAQIAIAAFISGGAVVNQGVGFAGH
jgi:hypothetical protein